MILDGTTKPRECLKCLTLRPLRFGDWEQIRAVQILSAAEDLLMSGPRQCPECLGREIEESEPGECNRCGRTCRHCEDRETEECWRCKGEGEVVWTRDEVYALTAGRITLLLGPDYNRRTA
jgi:hypothetical protein